MAYDPQNPLDAITGERAKRGKKNQSTFEDRNKITVTGPDGKPMKVQGSRGPGGMMAVSPEDLANAAIQRRAATGQVERPQSGMGDVRMAERNPDPVQPRGLFGRLANVPPQPARGGIPASSPPAAETASQTTRSKGVFGRLVGGEVREATQPRVGMGDVRMREREVEQPVATQPAAKQPVPQVGPPPARPRMDISDAMFGDTGLQTIGQAMRQAPPPERGLTREMNEQILRDVLAGEAQRLRGIKREDDALSRAFPDVSFRPKEQVEAAQKPVISERQEGFVGPERQSNIARADQLRAQIASEQQAMLAARRARGGSFREDTAPLERIAGMRQELAQYERAATPGQPIRVKTPEENLATEQSLARQASDIMSKDVADLRAQVASMPAGPERDAQAERLRSLEFQQQQQGARAGALPAGAVGPQPMGASVGLSEQMLGEARARTERQQEAAPRVAARQQELADVAMREGERLTGKRQDAEQQKADFARATREATLAGLSAPERMRQEAIATEQAKRAALTTKTGIETEESKARVAKIMSEIGVEESKARMVENQLREFYDDKQIRRRAQELDFESKSLDNELKRAQVEMQKKGMAFNPEMAAMQDAAVAKSMERLGISAADEDVVRQAAEGLKQNIDKTTYTVPSDAMQDVQRASQINDYVRGLKSLHDQGGPAAEIAKAKARRLASMFAGEITGQRASGERVFSNIGSATATGAGIGAGAGAVVGIPGGPVGVGTLAAAGAGLVGTIGLVAGTVTSAVDMVAQRIGMTSAEVEAVKSKTNEALRMLQEIAQ